MPTGIFYIVIKQTPELKVGAILRAAREEMKFESINHVDYSRFDDQGSTNYSWKTITENPDHFQEIEFVIQRKSKKKK